MEEHLTGIRLIKFFWLFRESMGVNCFDCYLGSIFANETEFSLPDFVHCNWELRRHLCMPFWKVLNFVSTSEHFQIPFCTTLVVALPKSDNLMGRLREIWGNCYKNYEILMRSTRKIICVYFEIIISHYRWPTISLFIVNIRFPVYLWTFYIMVLQFLHSITFWL
jgi:hypothetical protein